MAISSRKLLQINHFFYFVSQLFSAFFRPSGNIVFFSQNGKIWRRAEKSRRNETEVSPFFPKKGKRRLRPSCRGMQRVSLYSFFLSFFLPPSSPKAVFFLLLLSTFRNVFRVFLPYKMLWSHAARTLCH